MSTNPEWWGRGRLSWETATLLLLLLFCLLPLLLPPWDSTAYTFHRDTPALWEQTETQRGVHERHAHPQTTTLSRGQWCASVSAVHVRGERVVVLVVLPVVAEALVIRLLRRTLASPDDRPAALTWPRAADKQTSTQPKQTNRQKWTKRHRWKNT